MIIIDYFIDVKMTIQLPFLVPFLVEISILYIYCFNKTIFLINFLKILKIFNYLLDMCIAKIYNHW